MEYSYAEDEVWVRTDLLIDELLKRQRARRKITCPMCGGRGEVARTRARALEDLCDYIVSHAAEIYVREKVGGRWGAYSLAELPGELAVKHALRFVREGRIPVRVVKG